MNTDARIEEKPLSLIWAAFLMATLMYAGIGWFLSQGERTPINLEILNWVQIFLGLAALPILLTVFLLRQLLAAVTRGSYLNYCIVRWVLLELIGVFGLLQFILGGHFEVLLIFVAVSALAIGAARPGPADRAAYLSQFN